MGSEGSKISCEGIRGLMDLKLLCGMVVVKPLHAAPTPGRGVSRGTTLHGTFDDNQASVRRGSAG